MTRKIIYSIFQKSIILAFLLVSIWLGKIHASSLNSVNNTTEVFDVHAKEYGQINHNDTNETYEYYVVKEGDTFATVMETFGVGFVELQDILKSSEEIYDFTKIRLDKILRIKLVNRKFNRLEYDISNDEMVVVQKEDEKFIVEKELIAYQEKEIFKEANIESSLFLAGSNVNISDKTILELAEIFAWNIDFATQIQKGDHFSVLYNKRRRNGKEAPDGDILAATFTTSGKKYSAFLFDTEEDGKKYYDEDGNALVRQFLRSPLRYSRITSGFSYARFHPVLGKNTTHLAIDYAAASGTHIYSVGDGVIVFAGWKKGFGNFINIRHNSIYKTQYAHLRGYAKGIRSGTRVTQGQVIGYVGSTGYSTGPHLHYQIEKNGRLVNPLTLELPKGDPLKEKYKESFENKKRELIEKMK